MNDYYGYGYEPYDEQEELMEEALESDYFEWLEQKEETLLEDKTFENPFAKYVNYNQVVDTFKAPTPLKEIDPTKLAFNAPIEFDFEAIDKELVEKRQSIYPNNEKIVNCRYESNGIVQSIYIDYRYEEGLASALREIKRYSNDNDDYESRKEAVLNAYPVIGIYNGRDSLTHFSMGYIGYGRVLDYSHPKVLCGKDWKEIPSSYGISYSINEADVFDFEKDRRKLAEKYISVSNVNQFIANKETDWFHSLIYVQVYLGQGQTEVLALTAD